MNTLLEYCNTTHYNYALHNKNSSIKVYQPIFTNELLEDQIFPSA